MWQLIHKAIVSHRYFSELNFSNSVVVLSIELLLCDTGWFSSWEGFVFFLFVKVYFLVFISTLAIF